MIFIGPVVKTIYYVTADVYRLKSQRNIQTSILSSLIDNNEVKKEIKSIDLPKAITTDQGFNLKTNERVFFIKYLTEESVLLKTSKIVSLNENSALLATLTSSGSLKIQKIKYTDIFKIPSADTKLQAFGTSIGEKISYPHWQNSETFMWIDCTLANANQKYVLFDNLKGDIYIKKISRYSSYLQSPSFPKKGS